MHTKFLVKLVRNTEKEQIVEAIEKAVEEAKKAGVPEELLHGVAEMIAKILQALSSQDET